jgi:hypothetical protein
MELILPSGPAILEVMISNAIPSTYPGTLDAKLSLLQGEYEIIFAVMVHVLFSITSVAVHV